MNYIKVKNWDKFQHYKDRNPPWIKLHNHLLDDYDFECLSDSAKGHLFCIWMLASRTQNKIPNDPQWVKKKIGASSTVDINTLIKHGFLECYQDASKLLHNAEQVATVSVPSEEKRREETEDNNVVIEESFNHWWDCYPTERRNAKTNKCFPKWKRICSKLSIEEIVELTNRVYKDIESRKLAVSDVRFMPQTTTYLNDEKWRDGE
jgi:hypothetical protein